MVFLFAQMYFIQTKIHKTCKSNFFLSIVQRIRTCEDPSLVIFKNIFITIFISISWSSWRSIGIKIMKLWIQNSRFLQASMSWVMMNIKRRRWSFSVKKQEQKKKKDDEGDSSDMFPRFSSKVVISHLYKIFKIYRVFSMVKRLDFRIDFQKT